MEYNKKNLSIVTKAIKRNLSKEFLNKSYHEINDKNKMFGHCHTASGVLYKVFGSKNIHLYQAEDKPVLNKKFYHWWCVDVKTGTIIDITSSQYKGKEKQLNALYKKGQRKSILGFEYGKRVKKLYSIICSDLDIPVKKPKNS